MKNVGVVTLFIDLKKLRNRSTGTSKPQPNCPAHLIQILFVEINYKIAINIENKNKYVIKGKRAWAGDELPTIESNRHAIDLAQSHADYVWTLVAAALVFFMQACFLWVFPVAFLMFKLIEKTIGLRVSREEEIEGLDFTEHGGNAYPDFEVSSHGGVASGVFGSGGVHGKEINNAVLTTRPIKVT